MNIPQEWVVLLNSDAFRMALYGLDVANDGKGKTKRVKTC